MNVYFSDIFNVDPSVIEEYGAFNISLINDLPLFIDPFLLFNSDKKEYQNLHKEMLRYVAFLRDRSTSMKIADAGIVFLRSNKRGLDIARLATKAEVLE